MDGTAGTTGAAEAAGGVVAVDGTVGKKYNKPKNYWSMKWYSITVIFSRLGRQFMMGDLVFNWWLYILFHMSLQLYPSCVWRRKISIKGIWLQRIDKSQIWFICGLIHRQNRKLAYRIQPFIGIIYLWKKILSNDI